jgi:hypothetical protein
MGGRSRRQQTYTVQVPYYVDTPFRVSRLLKTVERIDMTSRKVLELGSQLAAETTQGAAFSSKVQAYTIAGWATEAANRILIQKMPFSTEVFAPSGTALGGALRDHVATEVTGSGYIIAGRTGQTRQAAVLKYATSTDNLSTLGATLATPRNLPAAAGNTAKAVIAGGNADSGVLVDIEELSYATDLVAPAGQDLNIAARGLAGTGSNKEAVFAGGTGGSNAEQSIQTVNFSDSLVILRGSTLSQERNFDSDAAFSNYLPVA